MFRDAPGHKPAMRLVFPERMPEVAPSLPLLRAEKAEFEALFGLAVVFVDEDPGSGPRWLIEIDPARHDNELVVDRKAGTLVSRAKDAEGLMTTFNLAHSLVALDVDRITDAPEGSTADAAERIRREVAGTFPGFGLRGLDRDEIAARHFDDDMSFEDFERWIAELGDAHTAIRRPVPVYNPPYAIELTPERVVARRVWAGSAAWEAGVRAGWTLAIDDPAGWLARTGAPPHAKALTAGRRAIALNGVRERVFEACSPSGKRVSWTERPVEPVLERVLAWQRLDARTGIIRLANWFAGMGIEDAFDEALGELRGDDRLILDLRGNTGGNLVLAMETRRRFLRERTLLGTIRFIRGDGTLADHVELWDEPSADRVRWDGDLIVLTDPLTYSASEDFLLGLQGLPHVTVIGQRSGGGSGRARTLRILDDMVITISTALTFDRNGTCIENHGIPVDIETPVFAENGRDEAMQCATGPLGEVLRGSATPDAR
jgi:carboxyl-terminal processing protease